MSSKSEASLAPFALWGVAICAAIAVGLLLVTSLRDGYHRDELYFLEASRHLAWGYVDQPPFSIALVAVSRGLFGENSLFGLRLFPALADGACVVLAGLMAREFGGSRLAQLLAALAIAVSPFLVAGHLAGPTIYDFLFWELLSFVVIRILRTGNESMAARRTRHGHRAREQGDDPVSRVRPLGRPSHQPPGTRPRDPVVIGRGRDSADGLGPHTDLADQVPLAHDRDVWLCRRQKRPWPQIWEDFRHYG